MAISDGGPGSPVNVKGRIELFVGLEQPPSISFKFVSEMVQSVIGYFLIICRAKQPSNSHQIASARPKIDSIPGKNPILWLSGCFDGCSFPTFVQLTAIFCVTSAVHTMLTIRRLCDKLREFASRCKLTKNGLKIRRPQGRGGSSPPPGTTESITVFDLSMRPLLLPFATYGQHDS